MEFAVDKKSKSPYYWKPLLKKLAPICIEFTIRVIDANNLCQIIILVWKCNKSKFRNGQPMQFGKFMYVDGYSWIETKLLNTLVIL